MRRPYGLTGTAPEQKPQPRLCWLLLAMKTQFLPFLSFYSGKTKNVIKEPEFI